MELRDRWVLVTGASSGVGEALARRLAAHHGCHLVLTARRVELLRSLAARLERAHGIRAVPIAADLSAPDAPRALVEEACDGRRIHGLVSSAGVHWYGHAHRMPVELGPVMARVNAVAPIELIGRLLPGMLEADAGFVLVISSVGAWLPAPFQSYYAGTKAMLQTYVHNLYHELGGADAPVVVSVCSPAGVATDMLTGSAVYARVRDSRLMRWSVQSPQQVARAALEGLCRRRYLTVPGLMGQALALAAKLVPRRLLGEGNVDLYRPIP